MAKSYRKTPIFGITTAKSEKKDKRIANRKLRRIVRQMLNNYDEVKSFPNIKDVSNIYNFDKDGKDYYIPSARYYYGIKSGNNIKDEINRFKKMMRK